ETRFEAELARDMEFVSHDLGSSGDTDNSFEQELDDQVFAAQAAENKPAKRGVVLAAVLGCVAIAGAVGVVAFSNSGVDGTDGPILVEASPDPVKVEPENPGGKLVPNQDRAVFAENVVVPEQEALVPGVEEPVDIAAVPQASLPSSLNGGDAAQKGDDRLIPEATETAGATDEIGALLAPRKVRTLVVRPDGTLVERTVVPTPEPVVSTPAPAPAAPEVVAAIPEPEAPVAVEAPTAPVVEDTAAATATTPVVTPEASPNDTTQAEVSAPAANEAVAAASVTPEAVPTTEEVAPEAAATLAPEAETPATSTARAIANPPTIADRPNDQPLNIVNPTAELANTQVAAAPAPAATTPAAASPFSVQLASLPSQAAAQDSANNLARQFSSVIGGRGLAIREAQIEGRGTFYRVRVGASSRDEANRLCGQIKAAGGDCFVTR
ncbi:MAG: SPOR domain-containing protein, partial [Pseudomonadota bacterium]